MSVILAATGRPVCTARLPGEPALLAFDPYSTILYAAGSGATLVTALDPTTCAVRHVFKIEGAVYGLAVAVVPTGSSDQLLTGGTYGPMGFNEITNDGSLGFIALRGGKVVMLDLLSRQIASIVDVVVPPRFVITGLYPPTTPATAPKVPAQQRASPRGTLASAGLVIMVCVLTMVLLAFVGILLWQRGPFRNVGRQTRRPAR